MESTSFKLSDYLSSRGDDSKRVKKLSEFLKKSYKNYSNNVSGLSSIATSAFTCVFVGKMLSKSCQELLGQKTKIYMNVLLHSTKSICHFHNFPEVGWDRNN